MRAGGSMTDKAVVRVNGVGNKNRRPVVHFPLSFPSFSQLTVAHTASITVTQLKFPLCLLYVVVSTFRTTRTSTAMRNQPRLPTPSSVCHSAFIIAVHFLCVPSRLIPVQTHCVLSGLQHHLIIHTPHITHPTPLGHMKTQPCVTLTL